MANSREAQQARQNSQNVQAQQVGFQLLTNVAAYPLHLVRTLIQVGYEPLPSTVGRTWFGMGTKAYFLPNGFTYMVHIRSTDGVTGVYRGLLAYLIRGGIIQVTSSQLSQSLRIPQKITVKSAQQMDVEYVSHLAQSVFVRAVSITVAHPFHVVNVRMIAYYVGRESAYAGFLGTVRAIYSTEGLSGFFSGVVPLVIGEVLGLAAYEILFRGIVVAANWGGKVEEHDELDMYGRTLVNYLVRIFTYPFFLSSTLMIVDGSQMAAEMAVPAEAAGHWWSCIRALYSSGENMRGNALFSRIDKHKMWTMGTPV